MHRFRILLVAAPPLVLAAAGLTHPFDLNADTARWWTILHLLLLPVFPLLAVSLWLLLRGVPGAIAWLARIAAYGFAVFYTGLDLLAGVATGSIVQQGATPQTSAVVTLFRVGNDLAEVAAWCFLVACAAAGAALVVRYGRRAVPGTALLLVAAVPFTGNHVYWPVGGAALIAMAAAFALLAAADRAPEPAEDLPPAPATAAGGS